MQAIILASGRGERFRSLTDYTPKPLLPLANRPLLEHLLYALTEAGCSEIFVTIGYAADEIRDFISTTTITAAIMPVLAQDWDKGPFASFQAVIPHLSTDEPFLLVPADLYVSSPNLQLLISTSSQMALLFDPVNKKPGSQVKVSGAQQITELTQSTVSLPDAFPNLPALRATPTFLDRSLTASPKSSPTIFTMLRQWLAEGGEIQGIPITDLGWKDIDTPQDLVRLNSYLLTDGWPPPLRPAGTYLPVGESMEGPIENASLTLGRHSLLQGPVLLGKQVQVGENCLIRNGTTLGDSTVVQANSELAQCITLPNTQVPSNVDIHAAVLDARGNIVHSK